MHPLSQLFHRLTHRLTLYHCFAQSSLSKITKARMINLKKNKIDRLSIMEVSIYNFEQYYLYIYAYIYIYIYIYICTQSIYNDGNFAHHLTYREY